MSGLSGVVYFCFNYCYFMMSSYVFTFKCHCRQQIDTKNKDRIVTEACGHSKCRDCFIKEESGCVICLSSKTCLESGLDQSTVNNLIQNADLIQTTQVQLNKFDHIVKGTNSSNPKTKDIRVLEEVIIKPFVNISTNESSSFDFPRIKEFQKFKYPPHITWQMVNGETEFECKICSKTFRSKSNRRYHFYCDSTIEKPFNCSICTKKFATKNHLKYHENRHNNIEHICTECGRTFLSRISLQKHSKIHTDDFRYICDHCDMKFYNKSELILHMYNHKKTPLPFQCTTCDKSFSAKFKLNQHVETHKGVKSHTCQFCEKTFSRNSTLTMHLLTHSGIQTKYECSVCSKSFDRQRSYDRHMKIKHGSTSFQCPLCDVQSGRKDNILRHIRNLHSDENFDEIIHKISKNVTVNKIAKPTETKSDIIEKEVHDPDKTEKANTVLPPDNPICQYQSVIQFAARSQTPPQLQLVPKVVEEIDASANVSINSNEIIEKNPQKSFNNELRVELNEPNERDPKISNISIYRQLLSPYLKPPPNLDFRNGTQEQHNHRGFQSQSDRLPIRKENVDIYRSILMSTSDEEQQTVIRNSSNILNDNAKSTNNKTESLVIHGQSSEYFSEMHWRKRTSQCFNQMEQ